MYGKFKIFKLWKSKVPNWFFCFHISARVDLLLNHKKCTTSVFLRTLNVWTNRATWNMSHFPILLQIPVPSIDTAFCGSPHFRSIPSLTAMWVPLRSRPDDKFAISDVTECRITHGIDVCGENNLCLLLLDLLYSAVVINCSNAQIPVNGWGLLFQMINFALLTKADI